MKEGTLILPHHLLAEHPHVNPDRPIFLVEEPYFFTRYPFHKQKLILHRASMQAYYEQFDRRTYTVHYIPYDTDYWKEIEKADIEQLFCCDPLDHPLDAKLRKEAQAHDIQLTIELNPLFLDAPGAIYTLEHQSSFFMANFYKKQRQRFDILMDDGKPEEKKYSFDKENRKSLPKNHQAPSLWEAPETHIRSARAYVEEHFPDNPGETHPFIYPVTHEDAQKWLDDFIENRLIHFGDYQDAIDTEQPFLYHSLLSPLLNIGLLTPDVVTDRVLEAYHDRDIPINNIEGFIRQVIGWREYMYAVYVLKGKEQKQSNFFDAQRKVPQSFWSGTTEIPPIDAVIKKVQTYAYAHHIERLMIMSNFMLLCEFHPDEVYRWFLELFIDAYDWVMVPNVYGMGIFADGGIMVTKPYISSSSYVKRMSNFNSGTWCDIWDSLYWHFIDTHVKKLDDLGRMGLVLHHYKNMSKSDIKAHNERAEKFLSSL